MLCSIEISLGEKSMESVIVALPSLWTFTVVNDRRQPVTSKQRMSNVVAKRLRFMTSLFVRGH
jgi:hypothetical protein